jgi:DNA repair photolyase
VASAQLSMFEAAPVQGATSARPTPFAGRTIYETRGRAREYRELACNLYAGCDHACTYCWSPKVTFKSREEFAEPSPRAGIIRKLEQDAVQYERSGEHRQVLFCFTCDPYQSIDMRYQLTRQAIEICHAHGIPVCTLTKGGSRALRDLDLFGPQDAFASTLTTLDRAQSVKWEPGAASPEDRIATLGAFHERGILTWVSLEPVIDPDMTLEIIRQTHEVVDEFKVGTLNYHSHAATIDWAQFARQAVDLLESLGVRYYVKNDLRKYLA